VCVNNNIRHFACNALCIVVLVCDFRCLVLLYEISSYATHHFLSFIPPAAYLMTSTHNKLYVPVLKGMLSFLPSPVTALPPTSPPNTHTHTCTCTAEVGHV